MPEPADNTPREDEPQVVDGTVEPGSELARRRTRRLSDGRRVDVAVTRSFLIDVHVLDRR